MDQMTIYFGTGSRSCDVWMTSIDRVHSRRSTTQWIFTMSLPCPVAARRSTVDGAARAAPSGPGCDGRRQQSEATRRR